VFQDSYRRERDTRLAGMPVIQNSELIKVVGIATGFATLCVEYQIIEHYVRRYEETVEKRKSGTLPATMLSNTDMMKVNPPNHHAIDNC
jgi:hypothetical protein